MTEREWDIDPVKERKMLVLDEVIRQATDGVDEAGMRARIDTLGIRTGSGILEGEKVAEVAMTMLATFMIEHFANTGAIAWARLELAGIEINHLDTTAP